MPNLITKLTTTRLLSVVCHFFSIILLFFIASLSPPSVSSAEFKFSCSCSGPKYSTPTSLEGNYGTNTEDDCKQIEEEIQTRNPNVTCTLGKVENNFPTFSPPPTDPTTVSCCTCISSRSWGPVSTYYPNITEAECKTKCSGASHDYKTSPCSTTTTPTPTPTTSSTTTSTSVPLCEQLKDTDAKKKCKDCIGSSYDKPQGFWTAIGCIPTAPKDAVMEIFKLALGLGGIFILIQILLGAFGLITSSGNPAAIQKARSRIIDSVIALLFVVFSVSIVQLIGIDIFKLPGMS